MPWAPPEPALPQLADLGTNPAGWDAALRMCPGLRSCPVHRHPLLYPVVAHRNRLAQMALYVASLAAAGMGAPDTSPLLLAGVAQLQAPDDAPAGQPAWWAELSGEQPFSDSAHAAWAACTCVIVSDFNTTLPATGSAHDVDASHEWSLAKHGALRRAVDKQWPGHVAWVNSPEPFSSALANTRGWEAIPTQPDRSIVHISVADLLHTSGLPFQYAARGTSPGERAVLPLTWYVRGPADAVQAAEACRTANTTQGGFVPSGSGVVFVYLSDVQASGGYEPHFLRRSQWGHEDWDLVCGLELHGLQVSRRQTRGFCHVWHERDNTRKSLNGLPG